MNSRWQNIYILCNMERRQETVEFVGNRMQKKCLKCGVCCVQHVKGESNLLGVTVLWVFLQI